MNGLQAAGFTGTMVYKDTLDTVFKGTSPTDGYIVLSVLDNDGKCNMVLKSGSQLSLVVLFSQERKLWPVTGIFRLISLR